MNEHLDFLYNWFSKADRHPQLPNQQFSQPTILTVKQELKQLSHDIEQTDFFYSKEFMRLKDHLFYPLSVHPAIFGMTFGYITSLYEKQKQKKQNCKYRSGSHAACFCIWRGQCYVTKLC